MRIPICQEVRTSRTSVYQAMTRHASDTMVYALSKFVSIPSVSSSSLHKEDCRQAAIWLRKCLQQLGANASLVGLNSVSTLLLLTLPFSYQPATIRIPWC